MSIQSRSHQYGTVFENWQIQDLLGQGSGGKTAVFRLKRIDSPRGQSALKVVNLIEERGNYDSMPSYLKKDYETAREECKSSALQEVWLMDDFQGNSNIVDYLDHKFVDWSDESGFGCDMLIRMELLSDLRREIRSGKSFSEDEIIRIGYDICQALILCHENGILHRDIKPENVFINRNGNYKLGDFGISRIISNAPMAVASTGIGTPEYAAPEQVSGKYDKRVDIYSLGLVLYELTNQYRLPFATSSYVRPTDVNKRMIGTPLPPPTNASKAFGNIILKACAFKPDERYQTARDFADALFSIATTGKTSSSVRYVHSNPTVASQDNQYRTKPALGDTSYAAAPAFSNRQVSAVNNYATEPAITNAPLVDNRTSHPATSRTPTPPSQNDKGILQSLLSILPVVTKANKPISIDKMIQFAERKGSGKAMSDVGMAYYEGKICPVDHEQAVHWLTKAINAGYAPAGTVLGMCYFHGTGTKKNIKTAVHYYTIAKEGGDIEGTFLLGQCYENGNGVAVDYKAAVECYTIAADQNHTLAQRHLAFCYESSGRGVKHDSKKAFILYQKAAEAGDTKSMLKMADYYSYGQFVKQDSQKSKEFFQRALDLGDTEAMCKLAQRTLPWIEHEREQGHSVYEVEEGCRKAIQLYKRAAEQNCEEAKKSLDTLRRELIAERKQDNVNYRAMAARLLDEYWPRTKS